WFTGGAEERIKNILRKKRKIAGFAEDPNFPPGDPRRNLTEQFYTLKAADRWMKDQKAKGAINGSFRDVRVEGESNGEVLYMVLMPAARFIASFLFGLR